MTIARLTELPEFHVAHGESDIRGWHLHDQDGRPAGIIEDLIVDTDTCRVREVLVDLDGHDLAVPVGAIVLDEAQQTAKVNVSLDVLRRLPEQPHWHSREREVLRATFFPELAGAPLLGELSAEDVEQQAYHSHEPHILRLQEDLSRSQRP